MMIRIVMDGKRWEINLFTEDLELQLGRRVDNALIVGFTQVGIFPVSKFSMQEKYRMESGILLIMISLKIVMSSIDN